MSIRQSIQEAINQIFREQQQELGITSGDIDVADAIALDNLANELTELIKQVCAKQPKKLNLDKLAPSWYIYTDAEGIAHSETYGTIDMDKFFYAVSKRIAFDDLSGETVQKIYFRGKEVEYAGWQPGMKYEYTDLKGNTIWVGTFEEWDH